MLNSIKAMIKEKQEFIEASQMIIEDAMDMDMDDSIVLGKEEDEPEKVDKDTFKLFGIEFKIPST